MRMDLTGQRFSHLSVIEVAEKTPRGTFWRCVCDCGAETIVITNDLTSGHTKSCGCLKRKPHAKDLTGQRFGRLTVWKRAGTVGSRALWRCKCDCGKLTKPILNMMYMVSNKARVKRVRYEKYCKNGGVMFFGEKLVSPFINIQKNGRKGVYVNMVDLSGKQKKYILARLVATAFVINPDPSIYIHVNHKDENPLNNLPENLEWVTPKEKQG